MAPPDAVPWDQQGPETVIYEPGSLAFLTRNFSRNRLLVPTDLKLCVLFNDAIMKQTTTPALDGLFFFSWSTDPMLNDSYSNNPTMVFAPFTLSNEDRIAWNETDLQGKLELSSLEIKHEALSDTRLVLPIWAPRLWFHKSQMPKCFVLPLERTQDILKDEPPAVFRGPFIAQVGERLCLADANQIWKLSNKYQRLNLRRYDWGQKRGKRAPYIQGCRFEEDHDQVLEAIKAIYSIYRRQPDLLLSYGEARIRNNLAVWQSLNDAESDTTHLMAPE